MANTELPSGGRYMSRWLTESLVSNILIIIKIIPGYDNLVTVGTCEMLDLFLY